MRSQKEREVGEEMKRKEKGREGKGRKLRTNSNFSKDNTKN